MTSRLSLMETGDVFLNLQAILILLQASDRVTNAHGCPIPSLTSSLTVGKQGPILLTDTNLIEHLAAFDRERIPERVVHAKGAGK